MSSYALVCGSILHIDPLTKSALSWLSLSCGRSLFACMVVEIWGCKVDEFPVKVYRNPFKVYRKSVKLKGFL